MHTRHTHLPLLRLNNAVQVRRALPRRHNLTLNPHFHANRDRAQITHRQRPTHVSAVQIPRAREGQESRGGQVVEDGGAAAAVQVAAFVGVVRAHGERPGCAAWRDGEELDANERGRVEAGVIWVAGDGVAQCDDPFVRRHG